MWGTEYIYIYILVVWHRNSKSHGVFFTAGLDIRFNIGLVVGVDVLYNLPGNNKRKQSTCLWRSSLLSSRLPSTVIPRGNCMSKSLKVITIHNFFVASVQVILVSYCCLFCVLSNGMLNVSIDTFS